jgi:diaminopimelate epimerase
LAYIHAMTASDALFRPTLSQGQGLPFLKMNGLGNDFVVVDARRGPTFAPSAERIRALGNRETGIGFDQLIALEPSTSGDAFMRIWNCDGGEVEACGNATRCVGWLLLRDGALSGARIETAGGLLHAFRTGETEVSVDMGEPRLDWSEIPLSEPMDTRRVELEIGPRGAPILHTPGCVNMGNPHVTFFVPDAEAAPVAEVGPLIEQHPLSGVGARRRDHTGLRHRRLCGPGRRPPPSVGRAQGRGGDGWRRAHHRLARRGWPCLDDRPGPA